MENAPKVSTVIPAYQAEKTIRRAINSVLKQTFTNFEILIVDNASQDKTAEIIKEIAASDTRVIYIHSNKNLGPAGGRNLAVKQAKGKFVAFLDADDEWRLDNKLQTQIRFLEENQSVGVIFSDCVVFDEPAQLERLYSDFNNIFASKRNLEFLPDEMEQLFILKGDLPRALYSGNFICISTAVVRKSLFEYGISFTPQLFGTEDLDFWVQLSHICDFSYWKVPAVHYYWQESSISRLSEKRTRELIKYHLYCRNAAPYLALQDIVQNNLEYAYKLLILEFSRNWQTIQAIKTFFDAWRNGVHSRRLFLYAIMSLWGPIPLQVKINIINRFKAL